jgi:hypothetical protein
MSDRFEHNPQMFVGVFPSGKYVFVGIAKRDDFDKIALPCVDHGQHDNGHVLSKSLRADGVEIVFQYWLKSVTIEAMIADRNAKRDGGRSS